MSHSFPASLFSTLRSSRLITIVFLLWALVIAGITIRVLIQPKDNTVYTTYRKAGSNWAKGKEDKIYKSERGFVYPPPIAAFFVPLSKLPDGIGGVIWRYINLAIFIAAISWWLRSGITQGLSPSLNSWIFLALLPLSLGSFNNGQVNPIMVALSMVAILGCYHGKFTLAALAMTAVTYLKIYPLAIGLLLVLVYPKQFSWRLLLSLAGFGFLSLYLQDPEFVKDQYRRWWAFRQADNRFLYDDLIASRDMLMVFRLLHIPMTETLYKAIQLAGAAAVAAGILWGRWQGWSKERLLSAVFYLGLSWMILLGPSTESSTYTILAPAVALAMAQAFGNPSLYSERMRWWVTSSVVVMLAAFAINAFFTKYRNVYTMSVQPIGALIFMSYTIATLRSKYWEKSGAALPASPAPNSASAPTLSS